MYRPHHTAEDVLQVSPLCELGPGGGEPGCVGASPVLATSAGGQFPHSAPFHGTDSLGEMLTPGPPTPTGCVSCEWKQHLPVTSPWPGPAWDPTGGSSQQQGPRFRFDFQIGLLLALRTWTRCCSVPQFPCLKDGGMAVSPSKVCVGYSTRVGILVERLGAERCGPHIWESDGAR